MFKKDLLESNEKLLFAIKISIIIAIWYFLIPDFSGEPPITAVFRMLLARIAVPTFIIALFK